MAPSDATEPSSSPVESDAADTSEANPLLESASSFRDDPFWDEMMDSICQHRREMDAQWDVAG